MENFVGELCKQCGSCCFDVSLVDLSNTDIKNLRKVLSPEDFDKATYQTKKDILLDAQYGRCPMLSRNEDGEYACNVYEHRPRVCRSYACHVVHDYQQWKASASAEVGTDNIFNGATCDSEAWKIAEASIPHLRSMARNRIWWHHFSPQDGAFFDHELIQITKGDKAFDAIVKPTAK